MVRVESEVAKPRLIDSLERVGKWYDFLNEKFFESALSKPIITFQPDEKCKALGWFVPHRIWKSEDGFREFEINLSANFLDRSVYEIAATLLHEMCHQYAYVNAIKDTCRDGYYHNHEFGLIAMQHGLIVEKSIKYGSAKTSLSKEAMAIVSEFCKDEPLLFRKLTDEDLLDEVVHDILADAKKSGVEICNTEDIDKEEITRRIEEKREMAKARKTSSTRKYVCPHCGQSVRATRKVNILCGDCNEQMVVDECRQI